MDIVGRREALRLMALGEPIKVDEQSGGASRILANGLGDSVVRNCGDPEYVVKAALELLRYLFLSPLIAYSYN